MGVRALSHLCLQERDPVTAGCSTATCLSLGGPSACMDTERCIVPHAACKKAQKQAQKDDCVQEWMLAVGHQDLQLRIVSKNVTMIIYRCSNRWLGTYWACPNLLLNANLR